MVILTVMLMVEAQMAIPMAEAQMAIPMAEAQMAIPMVEAQMAIPMVDLMTVDLMTVVNHKSNKNKKSKRRS